VPLHRQLDCESRVIASAGKIQDEFFNTIGQERPFAITAQFANTLGTARSRADYSRAIATGQHQAGQRMVAIAMSEPMIFNEWSDSQERLCVT
jgi:hypothetical protein